MIKFRQPEICCVSDIHVGVHQNSKLWHDTTLEWAVWLRDELHEKGIQDIIISGDLFHYRDEIAVNTIHIVTDLLRLWKDFNIVIIVGNHDAYYKDRSDVNSLSILGGWENITVIDELTTHSQFRKKFLFCPWGVKGEQLKKSDIIFGHFEIATFMFNQHKLCETGMASKVLLDNSPLIITGHFHLREERKYKKGDIVYLGNPFQMDFGDAYSIKGYYTLNLKNSEYKFYENKISPTHQKIKLSELVKQKRLTKKVRDMFQNNIVKLVIDKNVAPDDMDIMLKKFITLNAISITTDYDVNFNKFGLEDDNDYDLSGVDVAVAIEEFINLLEDVDNKEEIIHDTIEIYKKCK